MHRGVRVSSTARLAADEWDAAISATGHPFRFSHRSAAGEALQTAYPSYAYEPRRVDYDDGTSLLIPLVRVNRRLGTLTMLLAMPLGLEGAPLTRSGVGTGAHLRAFFKALDGCGRLDVVGGAGGSPPDGGRRSTGSTHVLDLAPGYESIWTDSFPAKTRNMCRKAQRSGLVVGRGAGAPDLKEYLRLYHASTVEWGYSQPPHPDELFAALLASDHAELWLARVEEEVVGGALMLRGSHDLLYWSGAMDRNFRHVAPSNAIIRTVIEDACTRGIAYLDFGASTGLSGVEAFKRSFGARPREYTSVSFSTWTHRQLERLTPLHRVRTSSR